PNMSELKWRTELLARNTRCDRGQRTASSGRNERLSRRSSPRKRGPSPQPLDSRHKRVYARLRRAMRGNERSFAARYLTQTETLSDEQHSFRFDVRRLDNRPPLLHVGFLNGGKGFRRLLLAWHNLLPEVCQLPTHRRIGQRGRGGGIELGNHAFGRPFGDEQPAPDRKAQLRKSRLVYRRDVRCGGQTGAVRDGVSSQQAALHHCQ